MQKAIILIHILFATSLAFAETECKPFTHTNKTYFYNKSLASLVPATLTLNQTCKPDTDAITTITVEMQGSSVAMYSNKDLNISGVALAKGINKLKKEAWPDMTLIKMNEVLQELSHDNRAQAETKLLELVRSIL